MKKLKKEIYTQPKYECLFSGSKKEKSAKKMEQKEKVKENGNFQTKNR